MTAVGLPVSSTEPASELLTRLEEVARLPPLDLSDWFNPFLTHFMRETLRSGGEVRVVREGDRPVALVLADSTESIATVFSRSPSVVEEVLRGRSEPACYSELDLPRRRETFHVLSVSLDPALPSHRFRHRVRIAHPPDLSPVRDLAKEVWGTLNDRWFSGFAESPETCFLVEMGTVLAGVAWATFAGAHGRLHSLAVRPGYRRMGIGTDLLFARLLWLEGMGVRQVLSEISEYNPASRAVAERAGMRPVGRIFLYATK